ncbi:DNA adenine methylase [Burkholderia gladioli]|uniref:DNA adenine methylase n=1 Tax=Burkholderia gladioli TaxID=28095 RepID=UPI001640261A|nr:DNA adenine methylase [Burkholderia gladioli]
MTYVTPLRYPGGKARLGPWIADLLRHNRISGGWYVEPYAGGAGAALYLLTRGYVDHIVINDADPVVAAFWWSIVNDTQRFLGLLQDTPVSIDEWHRQRDIHSAPDQFDATEVGFATFFLNRTNRSGILTGGVIGGLDQTGPYKIDARFNKEALKERIELISSMRRHISVSGYDALQLLEEIQPRLPHRSLIYLDPPYYEKGSQLYRNFYAPNDHAAIEAAVRILQTPWLVSYDNCPEIRAIYKNHETTEFSLHYSTGAGRPRATEVMFYSGIELHEEPALRRTQVSARRRRRSAEMTTI